MDDTQNTSGRHRYPLLVDFGGRASRKVTVHDAVGTLVCTADGAPKHLSVDFNSSSSSYQVNASFWITTPIAVTTPTGTVGTFRIDSIKLRSRSLTILDPSGAELCILRAGGKAEVSATRVATLGVGALIMGTPAHYTGHVGGQEVLRIDGKFPSYELQLDSNSNLSREVEELIVVGLLFLMRVGFASGGEQLR